MLSKYLLILSLFIITAAGCVEKKDGSSEKKGEKLTLETINRDAKAIGNLRSLIISKDDQILSEKYFHSYRSDSLDHVRSVTKSVIGILTGIAIEKGFIESIDQPIGDYLGDSYPKYEDKLSRITIRHLLTMTAGFDWDESTVAMFNQWVSSSDPIQFVLSRKMVSKPGEKFEYNSGIPHLLSVIITKSSGMTTFEFANKYLFNPLGISGIRWQRINGYYNGGAGLELKPRDMLKIGQLMIDSGSYMENQILSPSWVENSTKGQVSIQGEQEYGYLWWTEKEANERNAAAIGYGGQFILILPDRGVTVVATSNWRSLGRGVATKQTGVVAKLISDKIYPFIKDLD